MGNFLSIKAITDTYADIEGDGIIFGNPVSRDRQGEFFTKSTDFELDRVPVKEMFLEHGLDSVEYPIGEWLSHAIHDKGIKFVGRIFRGARLKESIKRFADALGKGADWIESQYNSGVSKVEQYISDIKAGAIGLSTGSVKHRTRSENGQLKLWPVFEVSLTNSPVEHRTLGTVAIKSLVALRPDLGLDSVTVEDGDIKIELESETSDSGVWHKIKSIFIKREKADKASDDTSQGATEMELKDLKDALAEANKPLVESVKAITQWVENQTKEAEAVKALKAKESETKKPDEKNHDEQKPEALAIKSLEGKISDIRTQIIVLQSDRTAENATATDQAIKALQGKIAPLKSALETLTGETEKKTVDPELIALKAQVELLSRRTDGSQQAPGSGSKPKLNLSKGANLTAGFEVE